MKRSAPVWPMSGVEEPKAGQRRQSVELSKKTDASEELEVLIPRRPSKPASAVHLTVDGSTHAQADIKSQAPHTSLLQVFPKWLRVTSLWFKGDERWQARGWAAAGVLLSLGTTLMLVVVSYVHRDMETAMSGKDQGGFYGAIWKYAFIILIAAPLFAATDFVELRLVLEWRRWLTNTLMSGYFANRTFFKLHHQLGLLDNPDQRMCDDVPAFTDASVTLVIGIVRKFFMMVGFSGVLWTVAPSLVFFLLVYAAIGTWLTTAVFGKRLMQLQFLQLQKEGDLRFDLVRARENSESIAFYKGEKHEERCASLRLVLLVAVVRIKIVWATFLALWTNFYQHATLLLPSLLTAPRYFAGEVEFGVITQVSFAFGRIESALNYILNHLNELSGLAAQAERLDALLAAVRQIESPGPSILHETGEAISLRLEALCVCTPDGRRQLCQDLSIEVSKGQSLLVVGHSGCGKSSLLRAIAGLWTRGTGKVVTPAAASLFFLPQKPYMPLGSLRSQLLFPSGADCAHWIGNREGPVPDAELLSLLKEVELSELVERVGGLEAEAEWSHVLSLGEQQRVAFLRLLLHAPKLAFLDEATGALDSATEAALYTRLRSYCTSYISVGHRMELLQYHTHVLEHVGATRWQLSTVEEFRARQAAR
ncbi:hypothetical protein CVIRNUC_000368 [Coccomyxa viridis]|uniref:Uncharacterized protein n=1 Tax=Coccomyxa viridis TaxID=1274662 RepID=A0AAV1HQV5_9CHLO|nr:hypothetical protein CVIRNUC_000368 [Coccomyxa viridis]